MFYCLPVLAKQHSVGAINRVMKDEIRFDEEMIEYEKLNNLLPDVKKPKPVQDIPYVLTDAYFNFKYTDILSFSFLTEGGKEWVLVDIFCHKMKTESTIQVHSSKEDWFEFIYKIEKEELQRESNKEPNKE